MSAGLCARLAAGDVFHMRAHVTHQRRGALRHGFSTRVDYVLLSPETARPKTLFARNRFSLFAVHDRDHGGPRGDGRGAPWARETFAAAGLAWDDTQTLALLTQPRFLGYWFNPVSFWLAMRGETLIAVIAEVSNTFGQRHSYLCHHAGFSPIVDGDTLNAPKCFHVSPFQDVAGQYRFRFAIGPDAIAITIVQIDGEEGLVATMRGPLDTLTTRAILAAALARPGGALRVVAMIYWHALCLKLKGARYRPLPAPPDQDIS